MSIGNDMVVLSSYFLKEIKEFPLDHHGKIACETRYKKEVAHDIGEMLAGETLTAQELMQVFRKEMQEEQKTQIYKPSQIAEKHGYVIKRKGYLIPGNLLVPGQFYYHPRLHVVPPPPVLHISDDGMISASYDEQPFFLEMIDSFTIKELIDYFYRKKLSVCPDHLYQRDYGAFEHLLKFWDVDFLLYLIDEAFVCSLDYGKPSPESPLDIQAYEAEARGVFEARKNTCYEEGIDRVFSRISV